MKNLVLNISASLLFAGITAFGQSVTKSELRTVQNSAFKKGEVLDYVVSYGFVNAAKASLKVTNDDKMINKRSTYHVVGEGKTLGGFNWFFKVDDRYESYIDKEALLPWYFIRKVREGGFKLDRRISFDHYANKATIEKDKYTINENTHDLMSAFYFCRTLDLQNAKMDEVYTIPTFFDKENYPLRIKFLGREEVKTDVGTVRCLKFRPLLQEGRVFKEEEDMTIWISDDVNKVPVRLKTELLIGSLKMDLVSYSSLMGALALVK